MKTQYRISKKGDGYHPQTRRKVLFFFWGKWKRIARHIHGFGLYDTDEHSNTLEECRSIIDDYHEWIIRNKTDTTIYADYCIGNHKKDTIDEAAKDLYDNTMELCSIPAITKEGKINPEFKKASEKFHKKYVN